VLDIPKGYVYDGGAQLATPLSASPVVAIKAHSNPNKLIVQFAKADLDNNAPEGESVPLTLTANFMHDGVQKQLTSTARVEVVK
jgi:quinohemoprotein ethanol dehydrogenase